MVVWTGVVKMRLCFISLLFSGCTVAGMGEGSSVSGLASWQGWSEIHEMETNCSTLSCCTLSCCTLSCCMLVVLYCNWGAGSVFHLTLYYLLCYPSMWCFSSFPWTINSSLFHYFTVSLFLIFQLEEAKRSFITFLRTTAIVTADAPDHGPGFRKLMEQLSADPRWVE